MSQSNKKKSDLSNSTFQGLFMISASKNYLSIKISAKKKLLSIATNKKLLSLEP